ncbi:RnfABCDGE type electron transport complex subunit D [Candidatus Giovannonibacteria bacterium]|nr:RnfABCDGE type electron transport complex subunit D [Candidatus Giovannonibacteria bacterium]
MNFMKFDIKYFMVAYLGGLLGLSSWYFGNLETFFTGLFIAILYSVLDVLWTYMRDKIWYFPVSSLISGFVLALVAYPDSPIGMIFLLPFFAVISKQVIWIGRGRHIFNPAAFSVAMVGIFGLGMSSWWGVSWGVVPLMITALCGLFITWYLVKWKILFSFLVSYIVFSALFFYGSAASEHVMDLAVSLADGTLIFFATVMLIEPMTSMFNDGKERIIYGVLVGFFAILAAYFIEGTFSLRADPLILGLLGGNLVASLLFIDKK